VLIASVHELGLEMPTFSATPTLASRVPQFAV